MVEILTNFQGEAIVAISLVMVFIILRMIENNRQLKLDAVNAGNQIGYDDLMQELAAERDRRRNMEIELAGCHKMSTFLLEYIDGSPALSVRDAIMEAPTEDDQSEFILVTVGPPPLDLDLISFRSVQGMTGLTYHVLENPESVEFMRYMDRKRKRGATPKYLHFAMHGTESGLIFRDTVFRWQALSAYLDGVQVVVFSSCESYPGEALGGIVPFIVTMGEEVENTEAAIFAELFWTEIGSGASPQDAYARAVSRSPTDLREMVEAHY